MPAGTTGETIDVAGFGLAVRTRGTDLATERIGAVGDAGVQLRLLAARTAPEGPSTWTWLAGDRGAMSPGLQRLVTRELGDEKAWLLRWNAGRWPRGPIVLGLPLDRDVPALELGIVAPLSPTRLALSEGPLPLSAEGVAHFRAVHDATGAPGLVGSRLRLLDGEAVAISARWNVATERLPAAARCFGAGELIRDVAEGLLEGAAGASVVVEGAWTPAPDDGIALEVGPVAAGRVTSLARAVFGEGADAPLVQAARDLHQKSAFRARVEFDRDGVSAVSIVLGPRGQSLTSRW